jgi:glutathione S-transferase
MNADLHRLDRALDGSAFLAGDTPTIADMSCCGYLFWADQAEVDLGRWPAVVAWLERIRSLPRFKAPYDLLDDRFPIRPGTRT